MRYDDPKDIERGDPEEFEPEDSFGDLCRPKPVGMHSKFAQSIVRNRIGILEREEAQQTAATQDSERCYTESTRRDVNAYSGGPATIPHIGAIEKRKVR